MYSLLASLLFFFRRASFSCALTFMSLTLWGELSSVCVWASLLGDFTLILEGDATSFGLLPLLLLCAFLCYLLYL
jgi:hypothetical protein